MTAGNEKIRRPPNGPPRRPGLPAESSVVTEKTFISPKGRAFQILRTNEKDPKDPDQSEPTRKKAARPTTK
jgi:hypothetical protein